ncbi:MAG: glycosyltransferase [Thermodesulfobacteriota bacterium]
MPSVLIGIPVLNNLEMTRCCLRHLLGNTVIDPSLQVSLFILDNGSSQDIAGMLRAEFSSCRFPLHYRKNPRNLGVGIAWNQILQFSPSPLPSGDLEYDFYVILNNDAMVCSDWLRPLVAAMESNPRIGWVSCLENGSPLLPELLEAHVISKAYRVDPAAPFDAAAIERSMAGIYAKWGGFDAYCRMIRERGLPLFNPFRGEGRSAVAFMVRRAMVQQIGFFDEDFWPIGIAEDLEYFLRMERILTPAWLSVERYPAEDRWQAGFCGASVVHHNWCSTRHGKDFDGRKWDKMREKYWKEKFRRSKKYYTALFPK